jgi:hypothetical protein
MKTLLAVSLLALLALPARADSSTWQVSAYADFVVNNQQYDFTYSYDVTVQQDLSQTASNFVYSVDNGSWTALPNIALGLVLVDGPLMFSSIEEGVCCNSGPGGRINLDQEIIGPQGPTGQKVAFGWTVTPMPELSSLYLLATGIVGLAALKLRTL